jgi:hypothetical protein
VNFGPAALALKRCATPDGMKASGRTVGHHQVRARDPGNACQDVDRSGLISMQESADWQDLFRTRGKGLYLNCLYVPALRAAPYLGFRAAGEWFDTLGNCSGKSGRPRNAAGALDNLAALNRAGEFNEWHHGETFGPMGVADQAWSACMYPFACERVGRSEVPEGFFGIRGGGAPA